jgi:Tfp pilus assembly protein PilP
MKKLTLIISLLFLASCSNDEYVQEHNKKMAEIAKTCKAQVIKASLVPAYSRFDAYYDPANSQWSYFGTEDERFKFRKCLVEHGVQLSKE